MKELRFYAPIFAFLAVVGCARQGSEPNDRPLNIVLEQNECMAKGGIGIIDSHLYIVLQSSRNELLLDNKAHWVGQDAAIRQSVFFFGNKVWAEKTLPANFDLTQAVVVSFEGDKIQFFDFAQKEGCYYKRERS